MSPPAVPVLPAPLPLTQHRSARPFDAEVPQVSLLDPGRSGLSLCSSCPGCPRPHPRLECVSVLKAPSVFLPGFGCLWTHGRHAATIPWAAAGASQGAGSATGSSPHPPLPISRPPGHLDPSWLRRGPDAPSQSSLPCSLLSLRRPAGRVVGPESASPSPRGPRVGHVIVGGRQMGVQESGLQALRTA